MLSTAYALSNILLARAWFHFIAHDAVARWPMALVIYGKTILAKYIPGNIAQWLGRQAMGRQQGLSHKTLAMSSLCEIFLTVAMALGLSLIFVSGGFELRSDYVSTRGLAIACGLALVALAIIGFWWRKEKVPVITNDIFLRGAFLYLVFFLHGGFLIAVISYWITGIWTWSSLPLYALSWTIGTLTPGAPSGIGVREAAIVSLSGYDEPQGLAIALVLRVVTIGGDLLFYAAIFCWQRSRKKKFSL